MPFGNYYTYFSACYNNTLKKTNNYWLPYWKEKRSLIEYLSAFPAPPREILLSIF